MEDIGSILGLCRGIFWMASEAKVNKSRCLRLAERVKALEDLVQLFKQRGPSQIPQNVNSALWKLHMTLTAAHQLVKKCVTHKFVNPLKCMSEFNSANEGLIDTYHVLSGALQIDGRFNHPHLFGPQQRPPGPSPFAAMMEVGNDTMYYSEAFFLAQ